MKVRFSSRALVELERILDHIESQSPTAARRVSARIKKAIERIGRFPYSSRPTSKPEVHVLPLVRYPYLIFYRVDEAAQEVHILRVRHDARDPTQHLT